MKPRPRALGCTWPCSASNLSWSLNPSAANSTDSTAMAVGRRDGRYIWGPEIMGFVSTPYPARESVFSWSVYVFIYIYIFPFTQQIKSLSKGLPSDVPCLFGESLQIFEWGRAMPSVKMSLQSGDAVSQVVVYLLGVLRPATVLYVLRGS